MARRSSPWGGEADLKERCPGAEYVDAQGGIIMPGLVNAHTHIYSGLARGLAIKGCDPKSFLDNLEMQWWKIDRNLDLDATRAQVRCRRRSYLAIAPGDTFQHPASY